MVLVHHFMKVVKTTKQHKDDALPPFLVLVSPSEISVAFDSCNMVKILYDGKSKQEKLLVLFFL